MRTWIVAAVLLAASVAVAATLDSRGWQEGTVAIGASKVLGDPPERVAVTFTDEFDKSVKDGALLVYFSPTCPHCRAVAPELRELAKRLPKKFELVFIASGSAFDVHLDQFREDFKIKSRIIKDTDRTFASAMGVRSTPSALLVKREKKELVVDGVWYPYLPGHDTLVEMRLTDDAFSVFKPGEYQGNNTCAACHLQEMEAWAITHHSIAWETLVEKGDQLDDECNACHVTGKGAGGWTPDPDSPFVDVGCEACHGPGGPHDGQKTDATESCATCHDEKHSIAFSYEKGVPHIDHFATVGMSDEDYMDTRRKLHAGEMARPALAFMDGKVMGNEACSSCHEAEHAHWAASPHADAMALLEGEDASKPECVRCHATQAGTGGTLDDFRVDEGVGCESCHGPGEAHVAAGGGTDNIEKLGDDCPVCVIEAVCTSCHTAKWDPEWDLETDLPKVHHSTSTSSEPAAPTSLQ